MLVILKEKIVGKKKKEPENNRRVVKYDELCHYCFDKYLLKVTYGIYSL